MTASKNINVLVVDDEPLVNNLIANQLKNLGYTVMATACDGPEAVSLALRDQPDLVLMDLQMPDPATGQDDPQAGLQAARTIQQSCPTPVILLTAHESTELVQEATASGVGAYLVKPVRDTELERAIAIAIARFDDMMALQQANDTLQARNEELDAFSQTVAHDLRNPLTHIIGFAELLVEECESMPNAERRSYLQLIAKNGRKMNSIIESLLTLAGVRKMDRIYWEPLGMSWLVSEVKERLVDLIQERNATISTPSSWPVAWGYGSWVEEIWVNYLSNAIKYGGRPPIISLGADKQADGMVRFWVRDNGPGLTPEQQQRLFSPFERLDQTSIQGYGLGLSIVRRIVTRLKGTVGVESRPGEGSLFYFTLPGSEALIEDA